MLVNEAPQPPKKHSGQKKESQIQYSVLDLLYKIQETKKQAKGHTGCPLIRQEGMTLYRKRMGWFSPNIRT